MIFLKITVAIVAVLFSIEATAHWWMNPPGDKAEATVLAYTPQVHGKESEGDPSKITLLPELYSRSAPMLRCTGGRVWHVQQSETVGIHLAFFEWVDTDTGSVLEAFRHTPEACMGSIGMKLISHEEPVEYELKNGEKLIFEHTIFRDNSSASSISMLNPKVHTFKTVRVAGKEAANYRDGIGGLNVNQLTQIRIDSSISRSRPPSACVIQGAVRGAANSQSAWEAFEKAVLHEISVTEL